VTLITIQCDQHHRLSKGLASGWTVDNRRLRSIPRYFDFDRCSICSKPLRGGFDELGLLLLAAGHLRGQGGNTRQPLKLIALMAF
jgi:hypothetical protein